MLGAWNEAGAASAGDLLGAHWLAPARHGPLGDTLLRDPEATEAPVDPGLTHRPLLDLLVQLTLIIASARLGGRAARHFGQPRAVGEIVFGIGIGAILTSGLFPLPGPLVGMASSPTLGLLAGLGLVLVVFQIGIEFEFSHLRDRHNRRATFLIATMGILVPFASGLGLGLLSWEPLAREADRMAYALFVATAFAITALPVLGRILIELDLHRSRMGTIAIAAAALTDVIGWLLLGTVTALTLARFSGPELGLRIALVGAFGAMAWWLLRPALYRILGPARLDERGLPGDLMAVVLLAALCAGALTEALGIYAVFGGFIAGVLLHDHGRFVAAWRRQVGGFVEVFFLPLFFTYTGMRLGVTDLNTGGLWSWCAVFVLAAMASKLAGCWWAARHTGLAEAEAVAMGFLMNTRGLMELVVLNVGLDLGVIPRSVFTMLVLMAVLSTVITCPVLQRVGIARGLALREGDRA
jgi:Kef-type K+ transport system membrane component KefB